MRNLIFIAGGLLLGSCGSAPEPTSGGSAGDIYSDLGKQAAWNEVGKDAIKAKLKDPDSAQFRNVKFHVGMGKPVTCGEVNAKNSFGGYSGFERFIAAGDVITVMESEMAAGEMDKTWQQLCGS